MATADRENTMRLHFGKGIRKPKDKEIFKFLRENDVSSDKLLSMYQDGREYAVFVKFQNAKMLADTLHKLPDSMWFDYEDGSRVRVTLSEAGQLFRYVRVFGLHPEVDDREISKEFEKLGLYINHVQVRVYYDGLQMKCYGCGATDHLKASCTKRASVNDRLRVSATGTSSTPIPVPRIGASGKPTFRDTLLGKVLSNNHAAAEMSKETNANDFPPIQNVADSLGFDQPTVEGKTSEVRNEGDGIVADEEEVVDVDVEGADGQAGDGERPCGDFHMVQNRKRGRRTGDKKDGRKVADSESSSTEAEHNHSEKAMTVPAAPSLLEGQILRSRSKTKQIKLNSGEV